MKIVPKHSLKVKKLVEVYIRVITKEEEAKGDQISFINVWNWAFGTLLVLLGLEFLKRVFKFAIPDTIIWLSNLHQEGIFNK